MYQIYDYQSRPYLATTTQSLGKRNVNMSTNKVFNVKPIGYEKPRTQAQTKTMMKTSLNASSSNDRVWYNPLTWFPSVEDLSDLLKNLGSVLMWIVIAMIVGFVFWVIGKALIFL